MPAPLFVLTETTDQTGFVIGVFADRAMALAAARSHARDRANRCDTQDAKTFGDAAEPGAYRVHTQELGEGAEIFVVHTPSGERDTCGWQVRAFEVIEPTIAGEAQQPDLLPLTV